MKVERTFLYRLAIAVVWPIYRLIFRAKAQGLENFPKDTHCIIMSNHVSAWDPITIGHFYKHNEIHYIAKDSLFKSRFLGALCRGLHAFPVARGASDMAAMRQCMQVLRDGHVLGIFPEGTRGHAEHVQSIQTGIAVLALKSDVPVIPVLIGGRYGFFGNVRMAVGKPVRLDDLRAARADAEAMETLKNRVLESFEALRPAIERIL